MKLHSATVRKFRNIVDSTEVIFEPDVTACVGLNESGKSAFEVALYRLNPAEPSDVFNLLDDYPRWLYTDDRKSGTTETAVPITATFTLDDDDIAVLNDRFGAGAISVKTVVASRGYDNKLLVELGPDTIVDDAQAAKNVIERVNPGPLAAPRLHDINGIDGLRTVLKELEQEVAAADGETDITDIAATVANLNKVLEDTVDDDLADTAAWLLERRLPKFFYFSEYSLLAGKTDLQRLASLNPEDLNPGERTALALLRLAGADQQTLRSEDFESRTAELEAVSNNLTEEMAEYWSQSQDLDIEIQVDKETVANANGHQAISRWLHVRVKDRRHGYTGPFDRRSSGFRWFFSFLAAFSEYADDPGMVILLDEPALNLHARAQHDFLRFIDERLAPKHQVTYSTHSPFMVQPGKLERARLVEDKGKKVGTKISRDVLSTNKDTLFPLQAALGYDIAQNLFVSPNNLVLEGLSDYTYIIVMDEHLRSLGRTGLDERWTLVPVGGIGKVNTFIALLRIHVNVTVLVDAGNENQQVQELIRKGYLENKDFITPAEITGEKEADLEDLFAVEDYLALYNAAFSKSVKASDLNGTDRLVRKVARFTGDKTFDHGRPADTILRNRGLYLANFDATTLDNFEKLFERINKQLPQP